MNNENKTHYRKAFNSPYLSSADIVEPINLTVSHVNLEKDHSKKTKDDFNTLYFSESEIRPGEKLKPMILNAGNSKELSKLFASKFIDDWRDLVITIYVDNNVRFGRDTVEGLRISPKLPVLAKITKEQVEELKPLVSQVDEKQFYNWLSSKVGAKTLSDIPAQTFDYVNNSLINNPKVNTNA